MYVRFKSKGKWDLTKKFLKRNENIDIEEILNRYGTAGVSALSSATPKRTGKTASSWYYEIYRTDEGYTIAWMNSNNVKEQISIALLIQNGHATRNGGYVRGIDYINPAMKPIFDALSKSAWKEVTRNE